MKEVSVVIPAYNAEKYLRETLVSVVMQTVPPKETIIVNDGSKDGTVQLVDDFKKAYPDKNIRLVHNSCNMGIGVTRNNGAKHVETEYVAYLSSDDCYHPMFFEMCLPMVNPETATYTTYNRCDEKMKPMRKFSPPIGTRENIIKWALEKNMFINFSSIIMPTKIFEKVQFEPALRHGEDLIFLLDTVKEELNWKLVPQPLLSYRIHGNQGTYTQHPEEFETLWSYLKDRLKGLGVNRYLIEASYQVSKKKAFPPWHRRLAANVYHKVRGYR